MSQGRGEPDDTGPVGALESRRAEAVLHAFERTAAAVPDIGAERDPSEMARLVLRTARDATGCRGAMLVTGAKRASVVHAEGDAPAPGASLEPDDRFIAAPVALPGVEAGTLCVMPAAPRETAAGQDSRVLRAFATTVTNVASLIAREDAARRAASGASADDERLRWARDLHDGPLQDMARAQWQLELTRRKTGDTAEVLAAAAGIDDAMQAMRSMIRHARPQGAGADLDAALWRLLDRTRHRLGLDVGFRGSPPDVARAVAPAVVDTVCRIAQEALHNVAVHAGATGARLQVLVTDGLLDVRIQDDGRGFEPDDMADGFGLTGMRERAAAMGGMVDVRSTPGDGTLVRILLPMGATR